MSLLRNLWRRLTARSSQQVAAEIARQAYAQVRHASERVAASLQPAEARGYIRARATPILRPYIEAARRREPGLHRVPAAEMLRLTGDLVVQAVWPDIAMAGRLRESRRRAA